MCIFTLFHLNNHLGSVKKKSCICLIHFKEPTHSYESFVWESDYTVTIYMCLIHYKEQFIRVLESDHTCCTIYVFISLKDPSCKSHLFKVWTTLVAIYVFDSIKRAIRTYSNLCCVELLANSSKFV